MNLSDSESASNINNNNNNNNNVNNNVNNASNFEHPQLQHQQLLSTANEIKEFTEQLINSIDYSSLQSNDAQLMKNQYQPQQQQQQYPQQQQQQQHQQQQVAAAQLAEPSGTNKPATIQQQQQQQPLPNNVSSFQPISANNPINSSSSSSKAEGSRFKIIKTDTDRKNGNLSFEQLESNYATGTNHLFIETGDSGGLASAFVSNMTGGAGVAAARSLSQESKTNGSMNNYVRGRWSVIDIQLSQQQQQQPTGDFSNCPEGFSDDPAFVLQQPQQQYHQVQPNQQLLSYLQLQHHQHQVQQQQQQQQQHESHPNSFAAATLSQPAFISQASTIPSSQLNSDTLSGICSS